MTINNITATSIPTNNTQIATNIGSYVSIDNTAWSYISGTSSSINPYDIINTTTKKYEVLITLSEFDDFANIYQFEGNLDSVYELSHFTDFFDEENIHDVSMIRITHNNNNGIDTLKFNTRLQFNKLESLEKFKEYWKTYVSRFKGNEWTVSRYPTINPDVAGIYVADSNSTKTREEWRWIVKNTKYGVYRESKGWIFLDDADAVHFKLWR